jgi:hypothetical protein
LFATIKSNVCEHGEPHLDMQKDKINRIRKTKATITAMSTYVSM